ncbi:AAA family ATPase [Actinoplanes lobatus]|uniref:DNA-binding CsgD family transcriptional regulator n=1 Tax=Actinoplanes lobatus TaxID=113568 RepID=A0A7W7HHZ2_9ACTN|nr:LuxR family transcriptional regulator [Actinoplanes lobatus]MBB4750909.1 DNA-binding CsgD family transcriptional regulator [Actinoplanes lobatus]
MAVLTRTHYLDESRRLDDLRRLADLAETGAAQVVLVEGSAGAGKTALVNEFLTGHAGGWRTMRARCGQLEQDKPLSTVRQLFEPATPVAGRQALRGGLPTAYTVHHRLHHQLAELARQQPVILVVDDMHLADDESLRWLDYTGRRLDGLPVLLLLTRRPSQRGEHAVVLAELAAHTAFTRVRLPPLSVNGVRRLAGTILDHPVDDRFVLACHTLCRGNPQLVRALLERLATATPVHHLEEVFRPVLLDTLLARLHRQPRQLAAVAAALAVLPEHSDRDLVAEVAMADAPGIEHALEQLADIGLLHPDDPGRLSDPGLRDAIRASLSPDERGAQHTRTALALRRRGASHSDIAEQLLAAPTYGEKWVVCTLLQAAREHMAGGRAGTAARLLRRAMREPLDGEQRLNVPLALATAQIEAGSNTGGMHGLDEGMRLAATPHERGTVAARLAYSLHSARNPCGTAEALHNAINGLAGSDDEADRTLTLQLQTQLMFHGYWCSATAPDAAALADRISRTVPGRTHDEQQALAVAALCRAAALSASAEKTAAVIERQLTAGLHAAASGLPYFLCALTALGLSDRIDFAEHLLSWPLDTPRCLHSSLMEGLVSLVRADLARRTGDLAAARTAGRDAVRILRRADRQMLFSATAAAGLADTLMSMGQHEEAEALLREWRGDTVPGTQGWAALLVACGRLRHIQGDHAGALADLLACSNFVSWAPWANPAILNWRSMTVIAYAETGRSQAARRLAVQELALARSWGAATPVGAALRTLGNVTPGADGLRLLEESAAVLAGSPARLEHARTLVDLGTALAGQDQPEQARPHLRRGLDLAQECGALPLAEQAYAALVATGARPRRLRGTGLAALTPTEQRTAMEAARGCSNRDIAARLFVSQRAVEKALTSVYRKLGIAGRLQLPAAMESAPGH